MKDCIFCKIASGEIPAIKIYEDNYAIAIMDLNPNTKGHALIIPKEHHPNLLEEDPKTAEKLLKIIQKIGRAQKEGLGAGGIVVSANVGEVAGQVIMHTHIHMIPRYENDGLKHWGSKDTTDEERTLAAEKIINKL